MVATENTKEFLSQKLTLEASWGDHPCTRDGEGSLGQHPWLPLCRMVIKEEWTKVGVKTRSATLLLGEIVPPSPPTGHIQGRRSWRKACMVRDVLSARLPAQAEPGNSVVMGTPCHSPSPCGGSPDSC